MKKILLLTASIFVSLSAMLGQVANPNAPLPNDTAVRTGVLDNGLTYYIMHNEKPANRAEFYFVSKVGAVCESPAQDGLAHFQEHMCLNGTQNLPGKMMIKYFEKVGVQFGRNINASTGVEQTQYMLNNIPLKRQGIIDTAILTIHEYSGFVTNSPKEVNLERPVIIEEWRTRRTPEWRMHEKSLPYLYPDSKYGSTTLIGSKHNLETFDPIEIVKFYNKWYRPDLQAIVVVGDIDVDAIEAQIKDVFKDIPKRTTPNPMDLPKVGNNEKPLIGIFTDSEASGTSILILNRMEPMPKEVRVLGAAYISRMAQSLIGSMINERLNDISKTADCPYLAAGVGIGAICRTKDAFMAQISAKEGHAIEAFQLVETELLKAKKYGFTDEEYTRAKTNMINSLERAKNNTESRTNGSLVYPLIDNFINGYPYMTPTKEYEVAKGYLDLIPVSAMNQMMGQLDFSQNMSVIYTSVEKDGLTHPTKDQFLNTLAAVQTAKIEAPKTEVIDKVLIKEDLKGCPVTKTAKGQFGSTIWTLDNGIKVIVKSTDFNKEQVLFKISADGGSSVVATEDMPSINNQVFSLYLSNAGVSTFPASMLDKMLTGKNINVSPFIDGTSQGVNASSSPKDFESLLQLTYLFYTQPRFDESEFNVGMNQLKNVLPNIVNQPKYKFQKNLMDNLFDHDPRQATLDMALLKKVNLKTLEKVYRHLFASAKGATVEIVGNVDLNIIKPLVEKYIGSIPTEGNTLKYKDITHFKKGKTIDHFTQKMTTPMTSIALIYSGHMKYSTENNITMKAIYSILDIIFTETIREEEGGTYGVQSYGYIASKPKPNKFVFQIVFDTNPEKADILLPMAKAGLVDLAENGPTDEQLNKIKKNFLKNIPESRITNSYWKSCIDDYYDVNVDRDTKIEKIINDLTKKKIQKMSKKIISGNYLEEIMKPTK
ncbi:MAG: insulinase family protein [Bacteroidales bacterium]